MNAGKGKDLVEFWEWVAVKGLVKEGTAAARRTAVIEVLDALGEDPASIDIQQLDIDDALRRFENLKSSKYTPGSLTTYKSRFRSAVAEYLAYLENPSGWRPGLKPRSTRSRRAGSAETPSAQPDDAESTAGWSWPSESGPRLIDYPFPIRDGVVAVLKLPTDLRENEARRLGAWLIALALPDDLQDRRSG